MDKRGYINNVKGQRLQLTTSNFIITHSAYLCSDSSRRFKDILRLGRLRSEKYTLLSHFSTSRIVTRQDSSRFYEWTANDKMAVFKNQAGGSTPSVFTNYFYNAQGERIKKHTRKGNKLIVTFYMDGGMFETSYVKPTGGSIDSKRFYNTLKIEDEGALIATVRVGKNVDDHTPSIKYIVGDHLNNSTAVLKTTGSLINREEFYPFGETSFGGFQYKRYRYNGKEKDEDSGLYEYGQRYYAPWVCRFVSVDPVAEDYPHLSSYNYASNRPITSVDAEGLQTPDEPKGNNGGQTSPPIDSSLEGNPQSVNPTTENMKIHEVKSGDTISELAQDYGVSQDQIREANPQTQKRDKKDQINIGEDLNIPSKGIEQLSVTFSANVEGPTVNYNSGDDYHGDYQGYVGRADAEFSSNYLGLNGDITALGFRAYNGSGKGSVLYNGLSIDLGAEAYVLQANVSSRIGTENNNININGRGSALKAEANVNTGLLTGEKGRFGLIGEGNIGAYGAEGEVTAGIEFEGIEIDATLGASLFSIHGGGTVGVYYDSREDKIVIEGLEHAGFGVGEKLGLKIAIPLSLLR